MTDLSQLVQHLRQENDALRTKLSVLKARCCCPPYLMCRRHPVLVARPNARSSDEHVETIESMLKTEIESMFSEVKSEVSQVGVVQVDVAQDGVAQDGVVQVGVVQDEVSQDEVSQDEVARVDVVQDDVAQVDGIDERKDMEAKDDSSDDDFGNIEKTDLSEYNKLITKPIKELKTLLKDVGVKGLAKITSREELVRMLLKTKVDYITNIPNSPYATYTLKQLKELCKSNGWRGFSKFTKQKDLLEFVLRQ